MPQLRIGFLAHNWANIEPWVYRLISQTMAHESFSVTALIRSQKPAQYPKSNWLYRLYYPLEKRVFARAIGADKRVMEDLLTNHTVEASLESETLLSLDLDVIIGVEAGLTFKDYAGLAKHGVWFLDMFDQAEGIAALDAVRGVEAVAHIGLCHFENSSAIRENIAVAKINPKFLLSRNALFMKEKAVVLILRELRRLHRTGEVAKTDINNSYTSPSFGAGNLIVYCCKTVWQLASRGFLAMRRKTGIRPDQYFLKTGKGDALNFDPKSATEIMPPGNNFWADPFLWEKNGKTYCFYEHFSRVTNVGIIQVGELQNDHMIVLGDALETDIHLSFPYLFEHENELYMMPETCAAKRIEIWRCADFPLKWELHATALEGQSVADSMILLREGKYWLFTNIASDIHIDNCSELHIFEIDGPDLKQVTPHAANPVVMDSRTARNAGRFHEINGRLYRPSQDNAYGQYGFGLNIMEVEELSLDTYRESLVRRIAPDFDEKVIGCHHFDARGDQFIIDALKAN